MAKTENARLEARIPIEVYNQVKRAAELQGMTLTGYLVTTLGDSARRTIEESQMIKLAAEDQARFVEALLNPAPPSDALREAAKHYEKLVKSDNR